MRHVEFFDKEHFEKNYHRVKPSPPLDHLIDFFWETRFDNLWKTYPSGFSDALFPNIGYTYVFNLGSTFTMQVGEQKTRMKTDGFLPRQLSIECHHEPGNILFGIKFKISPIIFEKKINFAEYKSGIFPLSYLMEKNVIDEIKDATTFDKRVALLNKYFLSVVERSGGSRKPIAVVSEILDKCNRENNFTISIEELARQYQVSARTLQRYFEITTSQSSKKTLQILRVRKAVAQIASNPSGFDHKSYGYYDYSHFYKHLRKFLQKTTLAHLEPHLALLQKLHKEKP